MTSRDDFRSAMSLFATGVTVVTSLDDEGEPHSMTANSFTSVCLEPPTVLVCVAHNTHTHGYVEKQGRFGVNILGENQEDLGVYFAKRPEDRQEGTDYHYTIAQSEVPMLDDSMVFFGCEVIGTHVYGDHTIYLGEVKEVIRNEAGEPLMFYKSRWYHPADHME
ncbi:MAG: flavin reductase family protein [Chloroflexi bacterium]|nr:flavin reductase family protein [Chloroflexota bacterium]